MGRDRRAPDRPHQLHPRRHPTLPGRLLPLPPRRRPLRRAIRRRGHRQPQPPLHLARRLPQPRIVPVRPEPAAGVLAHQHHRDMNVIISVAYRHPPRPTRIIPVRDPRTVQQAPARSRPTRRRTAPDPHPRPAPSNARHTRVCPPAHADPRTGPPRPRVPATPRISGPSSRSHSPGPVDCAAATRSRVRPRRRPPGVGDAPRPGPAPSGRPPARRPASRAPPS